MGYRFNLSDAAIEWLANGERGTSSDTMFKYITSVKTIDADDEDYPHDLDDFSRCRKLLEKCPEFVPELHRVKAAGAIWSALIDHWDEFCHLMDEEQADSACKLMRQIQEKVVRL